MPSKDIFVIQFRTDETEAQDRECIRVALKEINANLIFMNGVRMEFPENPERVAGVIFSGSSEYFVGAGAKTDPWLSRTTEFLNELAEKDIPTMGICYGSQFIAQHFGARLTNDEKYGEVGTFIINLTEAAKTDPVFSQVSGSFMAVIGHKETAVDLPDNLIVLGSTEKVLSHILRVKDKKIWAALYHPEINRNQLIERLTSHSEYLEDPEQFDKYEKQWAEVPEYAEGLKSFARFALADAEQK